MSKYKTPFPSDVQASKALEARTSKYKLPFKKDEPSEDLHLTLHNISQNNISLVSEIKLPKLAVSADLGKPNNCRKHKNNFSIHEEINMSVKSDKEDIEQMQVEIINQSHDPVIEHFQMKETRKSKPEQPKPKFSLHSKHRRRFLSSESKYADQDGVNDDYTQRSDESSTSPNKDIIKGQEKVLPTIGEGRIYKFTKEDSDDELKVWETLTRDIEKFQQKKEKMHIYKQRIKSKSKQSKNISKGYSIRQNSIEYIQSELKKVSKEKSYKRSKSVIEKSSLYKGLNQTDSNQKIEVNSIETKELKAPMSMIDKLKQIITVKGEKSSKKKLKMPLQFYLNSYQQIKIINPFFRKLNQMEGCILLNIGRLTMIDAGKNVYSEGDISKSVYIIIYGKILLSNKYKTLRKFALTGETLGEQELFENEKTYIERLKEPSRPNSHKYQAKTLNKSCLLKIHLQKYYKMYCELSRLGYKQQFTLIDNLFRINFINKQTNLHQNERDRIQTEMPLQKESMKYGRFFH